MPNGLYTVAICTYNRADSLARTLDSIHNAIEQTSADEWEVLIVDNRSTDDTRDVCERFSQRMPLRYVFEDVQGLSSARNRAAKEFSGRFLVFTDDDVVVEPDWLRGYIRGFLAFPDADYFGGKVIPLWTTPKPKWLQDERMPLLSGLLVNYDRGGDDRYLGDDDPHPFGASFAVSRNLLQTIAWFRQDLGVKGGVPGRGEEAEFLERAHRAGFRGAYLGTTVCRHWADPARLKLGYLYRYGVQKGIAELRRSQSVARGTIRGEISIGLKGLRQLMLGHGDRFRQCVINMGIQRGLRNSDG